MASTKLSTPIAGAQDYQSAGWLRPVGIDWIDKLAGEHETAAAAWADAVEAAGSTADEVAEERATHGAEVFTALAAGRPAPTAVDPAVSAAKLRLAQDAAHRCEVDLGHVVVTILAALRERRAEVEPILENLPDALRVTLTSGPADNRTRRLGELRRELREIEGPAIEDLSTSEDEREAASV